MIGCVEVVKSLVKVVRIYLISEQMNEQDEQIDYRTINSWLWDLQKETRDIKNKTVQLCWEWSNFSSDYCKQYGEYPKEKNILNYTMGGFVYDKLKSGYNLYSANLTVSSRETIKQFNRYKKDYITGIRSISSFKSNQPLDVHNNAIRLCKDNDDFYVYLSLLNKMGAQKYGINGSFRFKILVRDNSTYIILNRCINGDYKVAASKLIYDNKKKMWCLNLSYKFETKKENNLDENKILGIDIGIAAPIVASVYGDLDRFVIHGGEIEAFRRHTEARRRSLLQQTKYCGDGRVGHGVGKRMEPANNIKDKIAKFRNTANHKYSRGVVAYAVKKGCGIIQMEDLKGISDKADKFLKDWSYYDLQRKIEYKAKEAGIVVSYVNPQYTSQRCSNCGYIDSQNRPKEPDQSTFKCQNCGYSANADYNASQNIAIHNIEKEISKTIENNSANNK